MYRILWIAHAHKFGYVYLAQAPVSAKPTPHLSQRSKAAMTKKSKTEVNKAAANKSKTEVNRAATAKKSKTEVNKAATVKKSKTKVNRPATAKNSKTKVTSQAVEKAACKHLTFESAGCLNLVLGGKIIMNLTERHYDQKAGWF